MDKNTVTYDFGMVTSIPLKGPLTLTFVDLFGKLSRNRRTSYHKNETHLRIKDIPGLRVSVDDINTSKLPTLRTEFLPSTFV